MRLEKAVLQTYGQRGKVQDSYPLTSQRQTKNSDLTLTMM